VREPDGAGGVKELLLALAGILIPSLIGYVVYVYRPRIGFISQSLSADFSAEDGKIKHGIFPSNKSIEIGSYEFRNETKADIENFEIVLEVREPNVQFKVSETKALAKSAVVIRCEDNGIFVSIERFPSNERVLLSYSLIGYPGLKYVEPKKLRGKFNLYSIEAQRQAVKFFAIGFYYSMLILFIATVFGMGVGYILDFL
jgi:hypothetical protein